MVLQQSALCLKSHDLTKECDWPTGMHLLTACLCSVMELLKYFRQNSQM